jgi:hypothetical protein
MCTVHRTVQPASASSEPVSTCGVSHPSGASPRLLINIIWLIDNYTTGAAS